MSEQITVKWWVSDGYVGKDRPHTLKIDREEWDEMTEDERNNYVYDSALESLSIDWEIKP